MGNRSRKGKQLFSIKDLIYEVSDYIFVLQLAVQAKALQKEDTGMSLKSLHQSLNNAVNKYSTEFEDPPSIELKHLYPVAKGLVEPKENSINQPSWLSFDSEAGTYKLNPKADTKQLKLEMRKFAHALECVHARVKYLVEVL